MKITALTLRDAIVAIEREAGIALLAELREGCPTCHDPMAWHVTDTHPNGQVAGQWCYCEAKP